MSKPFDPELWASAQQALNELIDLPEEQRPAALEQMHLSAPVRQVLEQMLKGLSLPGLLDVDPGFLPFCIGELSGSEAQPMAGQGGIPTSVGSWTLIEEIGRGGMAIVFRAERALSGARQQAAVKLMTVGAMAADGQRRFEQEQAVLARLAHPAITPLIDAGQLGDGTPWLAMPLIEGMRIDQWCRAHSLAPREIVELMLKVCAAVGHAHRHLVLHRDIKPGNVMVDDGGHIHLLDFGIARLLDASDNEATRTRWRAITPQYAAPEQFTGTDSGLAMDVFSIGALLYHLLTGKPPRGAHDPHDFRITRPSLAASERQDMAAAERQQLKRLLRGDLDRVLLMALASDPADRYDNVALLADDLQAWLDHRPVRAARPNRLYRARKFVRRHRGGVAATLVIALAIIGGLVGTIWQAHRAEQAAARAVVEAERAMVAEQAARSALVRAESLNDFLLGLFRATRPLRPGDEMPGTDELLVAGAERALRDIEAEASLRADMLSAIATVYLQRQRADAAQDLIDQALVLSEPLQAQAPDTWARARLAAAQQTMLTRDFAQAQALLASIADGAAGLPDDHWLRIETRYELARIDLIEQRPEQARDQLQRLHDELTARPDASRDLRLRVGNLLGWSLASAGEHQRADAIYAEVIDAAALEFGPSHLNYAVHLANAGGNAMRLGAFDRAEHWLAEALSIYDRIGAEPLPQRATARSLWGMLKLARGRHEEAFKANQASREEWARLQGRERVEEDPVYQYRHAMVDMSAQRFDSAADRLERALALDWPAGMSSRLARIDVTILLADSLCQLGHTEAAAERFGWIDDERAQLDYNDARWLAWLAHARAVCAYRLGNFEAALATMDQADALSTELPAGYLNEIANRDLFRATIWLAVGQPDKACPGVQDLLGRLADADLADHPLVLRGRDMIAGCPT